MIYSRGRWSSASSNRLTGWLVWSLCQIAAISARRRWATRTVTPAGVRPPCDSRLSCPLRVLKTDSMTLRSGAGTGCPAGAARLCGRAGSG
jgi:hypothetical protein